MGNQRRNPPSKKFNGSNVHNGGSISQSGQPSRSQTPRPKRGNGGRNSGGSMNIADVIFGKGPVKWGHDGSKKNRKK
jgi:hypothetical protein